MENNNKTAIHLTIIKKKVVIPKSNGTLVEGEYIYFAHNGKGWYVQNLDRQQNSTLFCKGLKLIFEMGGKRGAFLQRFVTYMARTPDVPEWFTKATYSNFIAFVCDIALHDNPKLAHPMCYHKDFKKYVANLCYNYYIDEDFERFKVDESALMFPYYTL